MFTYLAALQQDVCDYGFQPMRGAHAFILTQIEESKASWLDLAFFVYNNFIILNFIIQDLRLSYAHNDNQYHWVTNQINFVCYSRNHLICLAPLLDIKWPAPKWQQNVLYSELYR